MSLTAFDLAWIFAGGALGSLLRWWIGVLVSRRYQGAFPFATLMINISGAFLFGFLTAFFHHDWHVRFGSPFVSFVMTGILGGYTTFSSFEMDAVKLWGDSRRTWALVYLLSSSVGGLLAAVAGIYAARLF